MLAAVILARDSMVIGTAASTVIIEHPHYSYSFHTHSDSVATIIIIIASSVTEINIGPFIVDTAIITHLKVDY